MIVFNPAPAAAIGSSANQIQHPVPRCESKSFVVDPQQPGEDGTVMSHSSHQLEEIMVFRV
jgi:hypothetical protein